MSKYWASRRGFSGRWAHESSMTGTGRVPVELGGFLVVGGQLDVQIGWRLKLYGDLGIF